MAKKDYILLALLVFFTPVLILSYLKLEDVRKEASATFDSIVSPLPFLIQSSPRKAFANNSYWRPKSDKEVTSTIDRPFLTTQSAISYDLTTGRLLYEKNGKEKSPMASLTKIMTAIVAFENIDVNSSIRVSKNAATVGENAMGLSEGEELSFEELLYGLMLPSGNDAAEALAQGSPMGRDNFIHEMNKKAEDLGLSNTHFTNPSGLEGDGAQYTTAYDLLVITKYAMENTLFLKVVGTYNHFIPATNKHKAYDLYNDTNLLTSYPGVKGVKTGFTFEAGLCLVTYLEHEGHTIIAVLLNSQNRRQEMKELLDYSLQAQGLKPPAHE